MPVPAGRLAVVPGHAGPGDGLVQVGGQAMADRYTYLPQIGLCIALAGGHQQASQHRAGAEILGLAAVIVVVSLAWRAWQQAASWQDSETLWRQALDCNPDNDQAHCNLGIVLALREQVDGAVQEFQAALKVNPRCVSAHYHLGVALLGQGRIGEGMSQFQQALDIDGDHTAAMNNLAWILATCPQERFRDGRRAVTLAERARETLAGRCQFARYLGGGLCRSRPIRGGGGNRARGPQRGRIGRKSPFGPTHRHSHPHIPGRKTMARCRKVGRERQVKKSRHKPEAVASSARNVPAFTVLHG